MPIEKRNKTWRVRARWTGLPALQVTVGDEATARAIEDMLERINAARRADIFQALAKHELDAETVWHAVKHEVPADDGKVAFAANITPAITVDSLKAYHVAHGVMMGGGPTARLGVAAAVPEKTLRELLNEFVHEMKAGLHLNRRRTRFAESAIERYEDSFGALFTWDPSLESQSVDALGGEALTDFRVARIAGGASPSTANRDQDAIQSLLTWIAKRRPQYMPAERPKAVKEREPEPEDRAMTPEHFELWWTTLQNDPELRDFRVFRPIFALTGSCALRIDEAQGLRRCDVEFERGRPKWVHIVAYPGHSLKSPGAKRTVGLTEDVIPMIQAALAVPGAATDPLWPERLRDYHKAQYAFERTCILAGLHDQGEAYLTELESTLDDRVKAGELTKKGKKAELDRAKARIPRSRLKALYTPHSLRHTLATRLADDGMPLNDLRLLLGQADIETTMRYIGKRLTKQKAEDAANRSVRIMPFAPKGRPADNEGQPVEEKAG